ncbi:MAG: YigZ family protein [Acholeplasmataceae bacterium]|jgi:uncharacterized YigZ family protein
MKYLKEKITNEVIIRKSRFITVVIPISHEAEIVLNLNELRKEYPKATHYCYAYLLGSDGQFGGSNDDGEPAGTAGIPILEVLKLNNVTNVLAVVIRYFGGIKLGAGGLIRAYSNSTGEALKLGKYYQKITVQKYIIHFNYDQINDVEFLLKDYVILERTYQTNVAFTIAVKAENDFDSIKHHFFKIKKLEEILLALDL